MQRWPIVTPGPLPQVLLSQGSSSESPYRGSSSSPQLTFSVAAPGRPSFWCALSWNDCDPCSGSRRLLLVLPLPSSALGAFTAATALFQRLQDPLSFLLRKRERKKEQQKPFVLKAHTHTWIPLGFTQELRWKGLWVTAFQSSGRHRSGGRWPGHLQLPKYPSLPIPWGTHLSILNCGLRSQPVGAPADSQASMAPNSWVESRPEGLSC